MSSTAALTFPVALAAVPDEVRNLLPLRPGLPGQPTPSRETVAAWVAETRERALALADARINLAQAANHEGNAPRAADYIREVRALVKLATVAA